MAAPRSARTSDYGLQLREKLKLKRMYGVLEKQFRKYFVEAERRRGNTGETLIQLLSNRAWTTSFTAWASARRAPEARQLVSHRAIELNGHTADIASMLVKAGDVISIREKAEARPHPRIAGSGCQHRPPRGWKSTPAR